MKAKSGGRDALSEGGAETVELFITRDTETEKEIYYHGIITDMNMNVKTCTSQASINADR